MAMAVAVAGVGVAVAAQNGEESEVDGDSCHCDHRHHLAVDRLGVQHPLNRLPHQDARHLGRINETGVGFGVLKRAGRFR